jgi:hypothetical protein
MRERTIVICTYHSMSCCSHRRPRFCPHSAHSVRSGGSHALGFALLPPRGIALSSRSSERPVLYQLSYAPTGEKKKSNRRKPVLFYRIIVTISICKYFPRTRATPCAAIRLRPSASADGTTPRCRGVVRA